MYNVCNLNLSLGRDMNYKLDKERERRLNSTGKWFDSSSQKYSKDIYLTYFIPLILIISLCATVYVALN